MYADLSLLIAPIFALTLMLLGLSYMVRASAWSALYRDFEQDPGLFVPTGLLMFVCGLFLAVAINDWSSTWPIFMTAFGWLMMLEATLLLLNPSLVGWFFRRVGGYRTAYLRIGGLLLVVLGGLLTREHLLQDWF